ncbi:MAG: hypothetical protein H8E90_07225 [Anaerolineales bacterium]|nr:hypothetical protein [Anaerolineales bacterium]
MKENLDHVLDERLTQLFAEDEGAEESLAQPQLEPLLRLAEEIKALPRPEPNPRALRATQARVREAAILKKEEARRGGLFPGWLTGQRVSLAFARVLAAIVAVAVIGFGTVAASADSLPHSPLYPVKRTTERVQLLLTFSPSGKAHLHLAFAERRLNETMELMSCCNSVDDAILMSMLEETDLAIKIICTLPTPEAEPLVNKALELTAQQHTCLSQMKGEVSTEEWCVLDEAIAACSCNKQVLEGRIPDIHQPTVVPE